MTHGKQADTLNRRKSLTRLLQRYWPFYLMAMPGLIYLLINNYLPMFGLQIAFKEYKYNLGIWGSPWNGLNNFKALFATGDAWIIIRNTLLYNILFIATNMVLGVGSAILLNEIRQKMAKQLFQTLILLPYLMSWVIVSYLAYAFLAGDTGLINTNILRPLGIKPVNFYADPKYWPFILLFANSWKGLGFGLVIYLSSLVGISTDYYEAATIDGASKWQQITKITLPLLKPTVITMLILSCGNIFRSDFGLFYQLPRNQGMLYNVTQTIDTYVYNGLMVNNKITLSAASGFLQSVVGFICIVSVNKIIAKIDANNAMF